MKFEKALDSLKKYLGADIDNITFRVVEKNWLHAPLCTVVRGHPASAPLELSYRELKSRKEAWATNCYCLEGVRLADSGFFESGGDNFLWYGFWFKEEQLDGSSLSGLELDRRILSLQNDLLFSSDVAKRSSVFDAPFEKLKQEIDAAAARTKEAHRERWQGLRVRIAYLLVACSREELREVVIPTLWGVYPKARDEYSEEVLMDVIDNLTDDIRYAAEDYASIERSLRASLKAVKWPKRQTQTAVDALMAEIKELIDASLRSEDSCWVVTFQKPPGTFFNDSISQKLEFIFGEPSGYQDVTRLTVPESALVWLQFCYAVKHECYAPLLETDTPETLNAAVQLWVESSEGPFRSIGEALKTARAL